MNFSALLKIRQWPRLCRANGSACGRPSGIARGHRLGIGAVRDADQRADNVHVTDMPGLSFAFGRSRDDGRHRKRMALRSTHFDPRRWSSRSRSWSLWRSRKRHCRARGLDSASLALGSYTRPSVGNHHAMHCSLPTVPGYQLVSRPIFDGGIGIHTARGRFAESSDSRPWALHDLALAVLRATLAARS